MAQIERHISAEHLVDSPIDEERAIVLREVTRIFDEMERGMHLDFIEFSPRRKTLVQAILAANQHEKKILWEGMATAVYGSPNVDIKADLIQLIFDLRAVLAKANVLINSDRHVKIREEQRMEYSLDLTEEYRAALLAASKIKGAGLKTKELADGEGITIKLDDPDEKCEKIQISIDGETVEIPEEYCIPIGTSLSSQAAESIEIAKSILNKENNSVARFPGPTASKTLKILIAATEQGIAITWQGINQILKKENREMVQENIRALRRYLKKIQNITGLRMATQRTRRAHKQHGYFLMIDDIAQDRARAEKDGIPYQTRVEAIAAGDIYLAEVDKKNPTYDKWTVADPGKAYADQNSVHSSNFAVEPIEQAQPKAAARIEQEQASLSAPIRQLEAHEVAALKKILREERSRPRRNAYIILSLIEALIVACDAGKSTTKEHCWQKIQELHPEKGTTLTATRAALTRYRNALDEDESSKFIILEDGERWQAVPRERALTGKDDAEAAPDAELWERVEDGMRHLQLRNVEQVRTFFRVLYEGSNERYGLNRNEILERCEARGYRIKGNSLDSKIKRISRINKKFPTLLGYEIMQPAYGRYKLVKTSDYRRAEIPYTGYGSPYPESITGGCNFDSDRYEEIKEEHLAKNPKSGKVAWSALNVLAEYSGQGLAVPEALVKLGMEHKTSKKHFISSVVSKFIEISKIPIQLHRDPVSKNYYISTLPK